MKKIFVLFVLTFFLLGCVSQSKPLDVTKRIELPKDHLPHEKMSTEWWYFTGELEDNSGSKYGYFFTYFLSDNFGHMISFSIIDLLTGEKVYKEAFDVSSVDINKLDFEIDGWYLKHLGNDKFSFGVKDEEVELNLEVEAIKPMVLNGENGYIDMSIGGNSAYYSGTKMSANGKLKFKGKNLTVKGDSWIDRQWGDWKGEYPEIYDWFSMRFTDNTELMLYHFRDANGNTLERYKLGTYVNEKGEAIVLRNFKVTPLDRFWSAEDQNSVYPLKWKVEISDLNIAFVMNATIEDQLIRDSQGSDYWEGHCKITEGNKKGYGYLEMSGY